MKRLFEPDDCVDVRVGLTAQDLEQSWMCEPGVLRNASQRPSVDRLLEFDGDESRHFGAGIIKSNRESVLVFPSGRVAARGQPLLTDHRVLSSVWKLSTWVLSSRVELRDSRVAGNLTTVQPHTVVGAAEADDLEPVDHRDFPGCDERLDATTDRGASRQLIVVRRGDADRAGVADQPGDPGRGFLFRELGEGEQRVRGGVAGADHGGVRAGEPGADDRVGSSVVVYRNDASKPANSPPGSLWPLYHRREGRRDGQLPSQERRNPSTA